MDHPIVIGPQLQERERSQRPLVCRDRVAGQLNQDIRKRSVQTIYHSRREFPRTEELNRAKEKDWEP